MTFILPGTHGTSYFVLKSFSKPNSSGVFFIKKGLCFCVKLEVKVLQSYVQLKTHLTIIRCLCEHMKWLLFVLVLIKGFLRLFISLHDYVFTFFSVGGYL